MDVEITGRHVTVTDAMRDHALGKVEHLSKYGDQIIWIRITLATDAGLAVAEVMAGLRRSTSLVAEARNADMYKAVDTALAKIEEQLRRHKDRAQSRRARPRGEAPPAAGSSSSTGSGRETEE